MTTNRILWRPQWVDSCYSGSVVTAGGLIFVGRNDGRLTALDESNGRRLWEFQTDGGVNAPASLFEHNGQEYVVVLAGGTTLAGSKHSDGLWLFSLDGTIGSLPRGSADPAGARPGPPPAPEHAPPRPPDLVRGKEIYTTTCLPCHGPEGQGGSHGGAKLTHGLTPETIDTTVSRGRNDMPAFGSALTAEQLTDLSAYVLALAAGH